MPTSLRNVPFTATMPPTSLQRLHTMPPSQGLMQVRTSSSEPFMNLAFHPGDPGLPRQNVNKTLVSGIPTGGVAAISTSIRVPATAAATGGNVSFSYAALPGSLPLPAGNSANVLSLSFVVGPEAAPGPVLGHVVALQALSGLLGPQTTVSVSGC